ncbi:MAG: hypothetical protein H2038_10675 [Brevundimonas sp.]|uniref:hypothetical protein n=1 Tax=Brevundimonas sp. TaxID=1871086 RepID=UPI0017C57CD4|nr:hypothetical protein [Brevundimonas sp.]MBA4805105.1 hypothetical protein [Brevundimonas sp.]
MLSVLIISAALTVAAPPADQVAVIAATPPPAEARRDPDEPATRRVCRFERATGSNMQQRVCRDVPRGGFVQDQQTREFLRAQQRMRLPDGEAMATPAGPNG